MRYVIFILLLLIHAVLLLLNTDMLNRLGMSHTKAHDQAINSNRLQLVELLVSKNTAGVDSLTQEGAHTTYFKSTENIASSARCIEVGAFNAQEAKRFSAQLANALPLQHLTMKVRTTHAQYMVWIPAQSNLESMQKKITQLKRLGITDFYPLQEAGLFQYGISLGLFSTEVAAKTQLYNLQQKGVRSAQVVPRGEAQYFRLFEINAEQGVLLEKLLAEFPNTEQRACNHIAG